MKMKSDQLIKDLMAKVAESADAAKGFKPLSTEKLNFKQNVDAWSILECIEHLNLYGDFYLPEIEARILSQKPDSHTEIFKSGLIGNYFANLMLVKDGRLKKMKSPKDKNPANSVLTLATIERFLKQMHKLTSLLQQSAKVNLTATKTSISISRQIKLRLGDTFRVLINHIERHILQAKRNV
ncbi:MAG: DinB family protein [Ginsengibacter sp.]